MSIKDENLKEIYDRVRIKKNEILMQEPCPLYEPEWDNVTETKKDFKDAT